MILNSNHNQIIDVLAAISKAIEIIETIVLEAAELNNYDILAQNKLNMLSLQFYEYFNY
jgi:hypothetical protein